MFRFRYRVTKICCFFVVIGKFRSVSPNHCFSIALATEQPYGAGGKGGGYDEVGAAFV